MKPRIVGYAKVDTMFARFIAEANGNPDEAERLLRRHTVGTEAMKDEWAVRLREAMAEVSRSLTLTRDDILAACRKAETGDWCDPLDVPGLTWEANVISPEGVRCGNGNSFSPNGAMALAWLAAMAPDALTDCYVDRDTVPLEIPDGFTFELKPPGAGWRFEPTPPEAAA